MSQICLPVESTVFFLHACLTAVAFFAAGPGAARAATSCRNGQLYEVKKGDTLSAIARECGSSITILSTVNNMSSDVIYPGQKLWIPVTYEIEKGDTLFQISRRFKTTIGDIMKMNSIKDPNSIQAGMHFDYTGVSWWYKDHMSRC